MLLFSLQVDGESLDPEFWVVRNTHIDTKEVLGHLVFLEMKEVFGD